MLITQRVAIRTLKAKTGRSLKWVEEQVKRLARVKDGKRLKVYATELEREISAANAPVAAPKGVKPLSPAKARRIQERCL